MTPNLFVLLKMIVQASRYNILDIIANKVVDLDLERTYRMWQKRNTTENSIYNSPKSAGFYKSKSDILARGYIKMYLNDSPEGNNTAQMGEAPEELKSVETQSLNRGQ